MSDTEHNSEQDVASSSQNSEDSCNQESCSLESSPAWSGDRDRLESIGSEGPEIVSKSMIEEKRNTDIEDENFESPISLLPGEYVRYQGRSLYGHLVMLTQFRVFVGGQRSFICVPLRLIESVACTDVAGLSVTCKDGTDYTFYLPNSEKSYKWLNILKKETGPIKEFSDHFAVNFAESVETDRQTDDNYSWAGNQKAYSLDSEIKRLGFKKSWKISTINEKYRLCASYPQENLVPREFEDENLENVANFRTLHRFPSAVWRNKESGAVLLRSSQPNIGLFCQRCEDDEKFMQAIINACNSETVDGKGKPMLIADARSFAAACANRAKGGGCEYEDYYTKCDIEFMGLPNIHSIRTSLESVHKIISTDIASNSWYSSLDSTKWIMNLSLLLEASKKVAVSLSYRPVLVHCSDGWDRTSQIVTLAQLILDPYYRTFQGFQVLVEKDWLLFGHKFADRCGHSVGARDSAEISPVFLQWLDAVHQISIQFPTAFEFSDNYLLKLMQHVYSCLFGTFLLNNQHAREQEKLSSKTISVWSYLNSHQAQLSNKFYTPGAHKVLGVNCRSSDLVFWMKAYASSSTEPMGYQLTDDICQLQRSQSYTDILSSTESNTPSVKGPRRLSDPDVAANLNLSDAAINSGPSHPQSSNNLNYGSPGNAVLSGNPCHIGSDEMTSKTESASQKYEERVMSPSQDKKIQYNKYLDIDGLTRSNDQIQQKVEEISSAYEKTIRQLQKRILELETRHAPPPSQTCHCNSIPVSPIEVMREPTSAGSDHSDSSWEDVSSKDTGLTLWLPDHAASACNGCNTAFMFYRRKHHCRQCGLIFCQTCANVFMPIPEQQLFEPVRVCQDCSARLQTNGDNSHVDDASSTNVLVQKSSTPGKKAADSDEISSLNLTNKNSKSRPIPCRREKTPSDVRNTITASPTMNCPTVLESELSSSLHSLHSNGSCTRISQKTCSQESINIENSLEGSHMIGATAEC